MSQEYRAWIYGALGVLIFSGSMPATRMAVMEVDPFTVTWTRAAIAGLAAILLIFAKRMAIPSREDWFQLILISLCVVIGFPLLTALALEEISSSRSVVFLGLLPLATAISAQFLGDSPLSAKFWGFALVGATLVVGYAAGGSDHAFGIGDGLMMLAVLCCGYGYASGAKVARKMDGLAVICWALIIALPICLPLMVFSFIPVMGDVSVFAWSGLLYIAFFSMLIGFIFWYAGLAMGGAGQVGQIQLLQPSLGLVFSALLLGETISVPMMMVTIAVLFCVLGAKSAARPKPKVITDSVA